MLQTKLINKRRCTSMCTYIIIVLMLSFSFFFFCSIRFDFVIRFDWLNRALITYLFGSYNVSVYDSMHMAIYVVYRIVCTSPLFSYIIYYYYLSLSRLAANLDHFNGKWWINYNSNRHVNKTYVPKKITVNSIHFIDYKRRMEIEIHAIR